MRACLVVVALLAAGCEAVPNVTYATDDASLGVDSDAANTCPNQVPPFATSCCGPIPCFGADCAATCSDCVSRCTLDELCCPNAQDHATCRATLTCP